MYLIETSLLLVPTVLLTLYLILMVVEDYKFELDNNYAENRIVKVHKIPSVYKLVEKYYPTTKGKVIVDGICYGGVKLVYQKQNVS